MFHVLEITLKQTLLIRVLEKKNRTNRRLCIRACSQGCVSMEREKDKKLIYCKELAYADYGVWQV